MAGGGGYGSGNPPWGGGGAPAGGGGIENIPTTPQWDLFRLDEPDVSRVGDFFEVTYKGGGWGTGSLIGKSGGAELAVERAIDIIVAVTETFTVQYDVSFNSLPPDFSDPINEHVYLGAMSSQDYSAGFVFSRIGMKYTGAAHVPGTDIVFGHAFTDLPGSEEWFNEGERTVIRIALDGDLGVLYLYVTPQAELEEKGHQLRAILPAITSSSATFSVIDRALVAMRGTAPNYVELELWEYNLSSKLLIPNIAPVALAGPDQALRICSIAQLDGTESFDPEGEDLIYDWRLIDGPPSSAHIFGALDGVADVSVTGFTDTYFSPSLGVEHATTPVQAGDVLMVGGIGYTVESTVPSPFGVVVEDPQIPVAAPNAFKLVRNDGVNGADTAHPTFYPDKLGIYIFDLRVNDGQLWSTPSGLNRARVLLDVRRSPLPRGITPRADFVFDHLLNFWKMVEDKDKLGTIWSALGQCVATELYTLWQYEYNKSLRDIQRQFIRRWLHYDLMLPEPLPELTRFRFMWSGISSLPIDPGGVAVAGDKIVVSAPYLEEPVELTMSLPGTVPPVAIADELQQLLRTEVADGFSVTALEDGDTGDFTLRVDAPFAFTFTTDSTSVIFSYPVTNTMPVGSSGVREGARTYNTGVPLEGLGIVEDDFIRIGNVLYRIQSLLTDGSDPFEYQRVLVKSDLPDPDEDEIVPTDWVIPGWVSSEFLNFYGGLVEYGDRVDIELTSESELLDPVYQVATLVETTSYGAVAGLVGRMAVDTATVGQRTVGELSVRLARVVRRHYIPVDEMVVDVPTLTELIEVGNNEDVLRRNVDYFLEEFRGQPAIRFSVGEGLELGDVWEGERPPDRLWAEYTYVDNESVIEDNFGRVVGVTIDQFAELPINTDYLSAVQGIWYAYFNGPTMQNLRIGTQILLGLPFAEADGIIEEIRTDFLSRNARMLIRDIDTQSIVRSYSFPQILDIEDNPETGSPYVVGDTVDQFAPLAKGVEIVDYVDNPTWFVGMLNQGVFHEVQKYHTFSVRVDSDAFNLSALLFAQRFILSIKPTYTYPRFIVAFDVSGDGDEIDVIDDIDYSGKLHLFDSVCQLRKGASTFFDEPWPSGGEYGESWRNSFDTDDDPGTPAPTFPVSDTNVAWGYDKEYLCPHDTVDVLETEFFASDFIPQYDSVFYFDTGPIENFSGDATPPGTIPVDPGWTVTLVDNTVDNDGDLTFIAVMILGDPGVDDTDYEIAVDVDTGGGFVEQAAIPFTAGVNTEVNHTFSSPIAVLATDVVRVRIYPVTGSRSPNWSRVVVSLDNVLPAWAFDAGQTYNGTGPLPLYSGTATYGARRTVVE